MPTASERPRRKRRGGGGCCGCLIVLLLLVGGGLWLARKWAPNHLNRGLLWSRGQAVKRYPMLDRWLPQAPGATPKTVFEPPAPSLSAPSPMPSPPPPTPSPTRESSPSPAPPLSAETGVVEVVVGTGVAVDVGRTVQVRYTPERATEPTLFMVGAHEVDSALETAVKGMKVGGKRKLGSVEIELVKVL